MKLLRYKIEFSSAYYRGAGILEFSFSFKLYLFYFVFDRDFSVTFLQCFKTKSKIHYGVQLSAIHPLPKEDRDILARFR